MVYGDKDGIIAGGSLEASKSKYEQLDVKVIPGGNHGFSEYLHHAQATEGIVEFVTKALSATSTAKAHGGTDM